MAAKVTSSVVIRRPVPDVFDYVLNLDRNGPTWAPDLESVTKTTEGPIGSGTTFAQRQRVGGRVTEGSVTFVEVKPNERIQVTARAGPLRPEMAATFQEESGGTRVTVSGEGNPKGPLVLLSPMFSRVGTKLWDARLAQLKRVLES